MKANNDIRDIVHDGVSPSKAADNLKIVNSSRGGHTTWHKRKVAEIAAPLTDSAQARTIRIHELLHANHTKPTNSRKYPQLAQNAIEDARVHAAYWPRSMPARANRDCLATALAEIHNLPPMALLGRADDWNKSLLVALRAMAIQYRLGNVSGKIDKNRFRIEDKVIAAFGPIAAEKLQEILYRVLRAKRSLKALADFTALMRLDDEIGKGNQPGSGSGGKATDQPMRIVKLSMPDACDSKARRTALARSGSRLNRARLARAVATGSTSGLFIRPRYLPGGTYLFDASGSMGLTDRRLNELCRAVPAATVAYYSGWGSPAADGAYGELVIYAEHGRRAEACDRVWGGNEIDLYAIQWLLRQPAPRVYVGDGEFCGGPEGQDARAAALLASAVADGKVQWLRSISELD